ncbi:MAG: YncE family protein [Hyphomicrobiaceae bacterium]
MSLGRHELGKVLGIAVLSIALGVSSLFALLGAGGSADGDTPETNPKAFTEFSIENEAALNLEGLVYDRELVTEEGDHFDLEERALGGLMGWLSPVAIRSQDGQSIFYNAWTELRQVNPYQSYSEQGLHMGDPVAIPSIRSVDLDSGDESIVAQGAFSLAENQDGRLAFFKGSEDQFKLDKPYVGNIVVQSPSGQEQEIWTSSAASYIVVGWAGSTLLAYEKFEGEALSVIALDGPSDARVLRPMSSIVAISPDGTRVLLTNPPAHTVELVDVATGASLDVLNVSEDTPDSIRNPSYVGYAGDWQGDTVAAGLSNSNGLGSSIILFRIDGNTISVVDVVDPDMPKGTLGMYEPRLNGNELYSWAAVNDMSSNREVQRYFKVSCNLVSRTCSKSSAGDAKAVDSIAGPRNRTGE